MWWDMMTAALQLKGEIWQYYHIVGGGGGRRGWRLSFRRGPTLVQWTSGTIKRAQIRQCDWLGGCRGPPWPSASQPDPWHQKKMHRAYIPPASGISPGPQYWRCLMRIPCMLGPLGVCMIRFDWVKMAGGQTGSVKLAIKTPLGKNPPPPQSAGLEDIYIMSRPGSAQPLSLQLTSASAKNRVEQTLNTTQSWFQQSPLGMTGSSPSPPLPSSSVRLVMAPTTSPTLTPPRSRLVL